MEGPPSLVNIPTNSAPRGAVALILCGSVASAAYIWHHLRKPKCYDTRRRELGLNWAQWDSVVDKFNKYKNENDTVTVANLKVILYELQIRQINTHLLRLGRESDIEGDISSFQVNLDTVLLFYSDCIQRTLVEQPYDLIAYIGDPQDSQREWQVKATKEFISRFPHVPEMRMSGFRVCLIGFYNVGKTFVLNLLMDERFPSGTTVSTPGFCLKNLKTALEGTEYTVADTQGLNSMPINDSAESLEAQKRIDIFLVDLAFSFSNYVIYVVDKVTRDDLSYLHMLKRRIASETRHVEIFVVHNFKDAADRETAEKMWKQQCKKFFKSSGGKKITVPVNLFPQGSAPVQFYKSHIGRHIFLARDGTPAGDYYNRKHIALMMSWIDCIVLNTESFHPLELLVDTFNSDPVLLEHLAGRNTGLQYQTVPLHIDGTPGEKIGIAKFHPAPNDD